MLIKGRIKVLGSETEIIENLNFLDDCAQIKTYEGDNEISFEKLNHMDLVNKIMPFGSKKGNSDKKINLFDQSMKIPSFKLERINENTESRSNETLMPPQQEFIPEVLVNVESKENLEPAPDVTIKPPQEEFIPEPEVIIEDKDEIVENRKDNEKTTPIEEISLAPEPTEEGKTTIYQKRSTRGKSISFCPMCGQKFNGFRCSNCGYEK